MDGMVPLELGQVLHAGDRAHREAAWARLIAGNTRLLLAVARSFGGGHDEALERYAYILEKLREHDFRRLAAFRPDGGATFQTWLTVTARRLCLDYHRARYGRYRGPAVTRDTLSPRALRRALNDAAAVDCDVDLLADGATSAEAMAVRRERDAALQDALARLTARERLLVALRFQDELPASRIAALLDLPTPFHVYRQVAAVLGRLRQALEARGIDGPDC